MITEDPNKKEWDLETMRHSNSASSFTTKFVKGIEKKLEGTKREIATGTDDGDTLGTSNLNKFIPPTED